MEKNISVNFQYDIYCYHSEEKGYRLWRCDALETNTNILKESLGYIFFKCKFKLKIEAEFFSENFSSYLQIYTLSHRRRPRPSGCIFIVCPLHCFICNGSLNITATFIIFSQVRSGSLNTNTINSASNVLYYFNYNHTTYSN
jgi:hypothetical protein